MNQILLTRRLYIFILVKYRNVQKHKIGPRKALHMNSLIASCHTKWTLLNGTHLHNWVNNKHPIQRLTYL